MYFETSVYCTLDARPINESGISLHSMSSMSFHRLGASGERSGMCFSEGSDSFPVLAVGLDQALEIGGAIPFTPLRANISVLLDQARGSGGQ